MKIACEMCNKVMDVYFRDDYEKARINGEEVVFCKECNNKILDFIYKRAGGENERM